MSFAAPACDVGEHSGADGGGGSAAGGGSGGSGGYGAFPVGSCDCGEPSQPFGSHALAYASGTVLPSGPLGKLDADTRAFYDDWKAAYLKQGCGDGRYYVAFDGGALTVSEAHGFGMVILAMIAGHDPDAKTEFDGMLGYFEDHPSDIDPGLMAWSQDGDCKDSQNDSSSATDGDLDIAYALLLADKQWGSCNGIDYQSKAADLLGAIRRSEVDETGAYVLLGDWVAKGASHYDATRSSDFMPGHFASFADATGDSLWGGVADASYAMFAAVQAAHSPDTGLLPDFVQDPLGKPRPASPNFLEHDTDGAYSYNACRDPWRIASQFLTTGDARSKELVQKLNDFARGAAAGDAWSLKAGYSLDGSPLGDYLSLAFVAPFGVGALLDPDHPEWVDATWDVVKSQGLEGYYGDTIKMLAMIAMSGNWWAPEQVPCKK